MFCKNRVALIGLIGNDAQSRIATCVVWARLGEGAVPLEEGRVCGGGGELRYREFLPTDSSVKVRTAEIHVTSILRLDRAETPDRDDPAPAEPADNEDVTF